MSAPPAAPDPASVVRWTRARFFRSWPSALATLAVGLLALKALAAVLDWAVLSASWDATAQECRERGGACWAFVREKARFILFGYYPREEHWRAAVLILAFCALFAVSPFRRFWSRRLLYAWALLPFLSVLLMWGGVPGIPRVGMEQFGGLPLTLTLAIVGIGLSYPLGVLLALGRTGDLPVVRLLCTVYIEFIRGVPLISILFMAFLLFPLFLPQGVTVHKILRAQAAIVLFSGAYMAEVVRGGLQGIPKGQYEAASALGLSYVQTMGLVILPQALKIVIPPTVNTFISLFKDTSLVFIISLTDLMLTTKLSFTDSEWLGFTMEGYVFIAAVYFAFCFFMGRASLRIERELDRG